MSLTVWYQLCPCPGAEKQRAWKEDPDEPWPGAKEAWEKEQRKSQERREACRYARKATRVAAVGKTRDEVRDLFISELKTREPEIPPEPFLEARVDLLLTGHPRRGFLRVWKARPKPFSDP